MEWLDELRSALEREYGASPPVMTLATADGAGLPHARVVVCRQIDSEGRLIAAVDGRTEKIVQLRARPNAEAVFWLPKLSIQFRLNTDAKVVAFPEDEPFRKSVWRDLSDTTRSLFFWPTPGVAADTDDAFAQAVAADASPPQTFHVLILQPKQVERLFLGAHPHRRRVWRASNKWAGVDVNP